MNKIKVFVERNIIILAGIIVGAIAGWIYWYNIGCVSGTCLITSSPINSTLWGAAFGGSLFSIFKKTKNNE